MKGKLFVLSGASGVGKNTIMNKIVESNENVRYSISATSRAKRPGETDGVSYYFVSRDQFEEMIRDDALLEYAEYVGNYYGTPIKPIYEAIDNGIDVVMDVEVVGAQKIKERMPEAVLVFVATSSLNDIRERLTKRGDVDETSLEERLKRAVWEYGQVDHYDYIVLNDDLDTACKEMRSIMNAEKCKVMDRIHLIKEEVLCYTPQ